MKNRDLWAEQLSDIKNFDEQPFIPGQYVPFDLSLYNPGGLPL